MSQDHFVEGTMAYAQRTAVQTAIHQAGYNLTKAAIHLRIGRTTLYRLIHEYEIKLDEEARRASAPTRRRPADDTHPRVALVDGNWYLVERRDTDPAVRRA